MLKFVLFILAIAISIYLGNRTKINAGIWMMICAFILGTLFLKQNATAVFKSYFPTSIFTTLFVSTSFFGVVSANGTMRVLTNKFGRTFKGKGWVAPFAIFIVMTVICIVGGGDGARIPMAALAASLCGSLGINPFVGIWASFTAFTMTMNLPWAPAGAINVGTLTGYFKDEQLAYASQLYTVLFGAGFLIIVFVIVYFAFKAHKKGSITTELQINDADCEFNDNQKKTVAILLVTLAVIVIPAIIQLLLPNPVTKWLSKYLNMVFCFPVAMVVMLLMKLSDWKTVVSKGIAWNLIVLVIGACLLFGEAEGLGVIDILSNIILKMPQLLVLPTLALVGAFLSFFVSGVILLPLFLTLIDSIAAAAACSPQLVCAVLLIGMAVSSCSPASSNGASHLSGIEEQYKPAGIKNLTKMAIICLIAFPFYVAVAQLLLR